MSIDDMIARDTRIDRLAKLCGWSRRETRACLEDVWALCYDRVVPYLPAEDIEVTASRDAISPPACPDGFVAALRVVGLARDAAASDRFFIRKDGTKIPWPDQNWRDRVYLAGASERVGYLLTKKSAGHEGGVKSGKSRRSKTKQSFAPASSETQARGNPPDPVPDPVPDLIPEALSRARAIPPTTEPQAPPPVPAPPPAITAASWQRRMRVWQGMLDAHRRLRDKGIKPNTPDLPKAPAGVHERNLLACERLLVEAGDDEQTVERKMLHAVLVAEAEAERPDVRHLDWFKPSLLWEPERFARAVDTTLEEARRGHTRGRTPRPAEREIRIVRDDDRPPPIPKHHLRGQS